MRNTVAHPDNDMIRTIYLGEKNVRDLEKLSEMTGLNTSQLVRKMVEHCLPKSKMTKKTIYELDFN